MFPCSSTLAASLIQQLAKEISLNNPDRHMSWRTSNISHISKKLFVEPPSFTGWVSEPLNSFKKISTVYTFVASSHYTTTQASGSCPSERWLHLGLCSVSLQDLDAGLNGLHGHLAAPKRWVMWRWLPSWTVTMWPFIGLACSQFPHPLFEAAWMLWHADMLWRLLPLICCSYECCY